MIRRKSATSPRSHRKDGGATPSGTLRVRIPAAAADPWLDALAADALVIPAPPNGRRSPDPWDDAAADDVPLLGP